MSIAHSVYIFKDMLPVSHIVKHNDTVTILWKPHKLKLSKEVHSVQRHNTSHSPWRIHFSYRIWKRKLTFVWCANIELTLAGFVLLPSFVCTWKNQVIVHFRYIHKGILRYNNVFSKNHIFTSSNNILYLLDYINGVCNKTNPMSQICKTHNLYFSVFIFTC